MDLPTQAAAAIIGSAALLTATGIIWRSARTLHRVIKQIDRFMGDWFGEPSNPQRGQPRKPGVPERLDRLEATVHCVDGRVERIEHEMHPNQGGSLRDAVNRIDQRTGEISPAVRHIAEVDQHRQE